MTKCSINYIRVGISIIKVSKAFSIRLTAKIADFILNKNDVDILLLSTYFVVFFNMKVEAFTFFYKTAAFILSSSKL